MKATCLMIAIALMVPAFVAGATKKSAPKPCRANLSKCPNEGCGGAMSDPLLNTQKNRVDIPDTLKVKKESLDFLANLKEPDSWTAGQDRSSIQGKGKEGTPIKVAAFLLDAKQERQEACNCGLDGPGNTDIHLSLVASLTGPQSIKAAAFTAEMTPRVIRDSHPEWVLKSVNKFRKKYVRVTGYLMLDTQHVNHPFARATNWEIHPLTDFEVCTLTVDECNAGKGWKQITDLVQ